MVNFKAFNGENEITREIIGAAIEVHRTLGGPGLLESVYEEALSWEMTIVACWSKGNYRFPSATREIR